ncbi:MAG: adenosine deaminase [Bacteroidia bacterium]|nr:adenosine deaminase [Bacteroidia bacterium]
MSIQDFIQHIPKAELHLHIEGTFEPELMFEIAKRNQVKLNYSSISALKQAYNFSNLQDFLDIYYAGASVLLHKQDFYDMTWAYLTKIHTQNVCHTEIFFDPQTHTERGVAFKTVFEGINEALQDGQSKLGISYKLILCFLRHLDEDSAFATLEMALPYREFIVGVGLDSSEVGNPPEKFERVFAEARQQGFLTVAHAGEEGPAEYVWQALDLLNVSRIDHGNRSLDDEKLVQELIRRKMPLTVCPLSNLKLRVVPEMSNHPIRKMLQLGLLATVNSDDPAYFGGYVNENYLAIANALNLTKQEITQLAKNSFIASFLDTESKQRRIKQVEEFFQKNQ